jgi:hypothetical protein
MNDYKPDHRGIGELMRSPGVRGAVELTAYAGAEVARSLSPDAAPHGTGYIDNFEVTSEIRNVARTRRWTADLVNTSDYAAAVEFGWDLEHGQWADRPGYHVLGQTADVIGD